MKSFSAEIGEKAEGGGWLGGLGSWDIYIHDIYNDC